MFAFGTVLPYLVYLCFPVCQGDSAALKMSEGAVSSLRTSQLSSHCRLKQIFTVSATSSALTHTNTAAPQEARRSKTRDSKYNFIVILFPVPHDCHLAAISTQNVSMQ